MPRLKKLHVLRVSALFIVICLLLYTTPPRWLLGSKLVKGSRAPVGSKYDILDQINMFIGTRNGGHAFPGASLPYGMAKASADCVGETHGGFATDGSDISGFSHMHDSGTGGTTPLGEFPLLPQFCKDDNLANCKYTKDQRKIGRGNFAASPGYFDLYLADGIRGEATVTAHTALYRFSFPANADSTVWDNAVHPVISIDLTNLDNSRSGNAAIIIDPKSGRISGSASFKPSFGTGKYASYFCADFKGLPLRQVGIWDNSIRGWLRENDTAYSFQDWEAGGGVVSFEMAKNADQVLVRVGLSFISAAQACENAEIEISDFNFERVQRAAEEKWRMKLQPVRVVPDAVSKDLQTIFWSGIYRTMLSPQDYTGENPLWNSSEPYFDSFYCIWDSFRSQHPLLTLIDPKEQTRMVRALIDIYKHEGKLPDCRMALCKGFTQGGSNADVVLADAFVKGLSDGIDWELGYEAVISDAEEEPMEWRYSGRGGLTSWKTLNYIPKDDVTNIGRGLKTRSISRTVEYAYNDFCIAEMARKLGKLEDQEKYYQRASNWKNLFKKDQISMIKDINTGFIGFLQPRYPDGSWAHQNPILCSPLLNFGSCYLDYAGHETYEGSCWLYTFFVPQDMAALVTLLNGPASFIARLDFLHESGLLYIGDEQAFLTVFLYHYAGRPGLSAKRAHAYIPSHFNNTFAGIPGNDDSGAMGSFVAFVMLGIFPNPGQDVYFIVPPFFPEVAVTNPLTGKTAVIRNMNFDAKYRNIYIQNATRNGKPWTKNWIEHKFFTEGGVLELTLGPQESEWGTREEDLPPSLSAKI